jgi:hypothetical protein
MGMPVFRRFPDDIPTTTRRHEIEKSDDRVAILDRSDKFVRHEAAMIAIRAELPTSGERSGVRIVLASYSGIMPDSSDRSMTSE